MKRMFITLMAVLSAAMIFSQTSVVPPANAKQETWHFTGNFYTDETTFEPITEDIAVAFDGDDVYFNFPNPFTGNAWMKGTKDPEGSAYIFAKGQYVGKYNKESIYYCGYDGESVTDMPFYYSESTQSFTCYNAILMNSSLTSLSFYCFFTDVTISSGTQPEPDPLVEAPEGLKTEEYQFKATSILYNADGSVKEMTPVSFPLKVGFSGNNVYVQGLCQGAPTAWAMGTLADGDVTFAKNQFFGGYMYLAGLYFGELNDFVTSYDSTTGAFAGGSYYMIINSSKTSLAPYAVYADVTMTKFVETAVTPAKPSVINYQPYNDTEGYGFIALNIPTTGTDGSSLLTEKLSYKVYLNNEQTPYVFSPSLYVKLTADLTEIPYTFTDSYDINSNGLGFFFFDDVAAATSIGIQSIYRGAGEERASAIYWYDPQASAIDTPQSAAATQTTYFNARGQQVPADTKGLLIRQQRLSDGTVRTTKIVNK